MLARLFEVLNTPTEKRQVHLDESLASFPCLNGSAAKAEWSPTMKIYHTYMGCK
jgi:hypothetical protein